MKSLSSSKQLMLVIGIAALVIMAVGAILFLTIPALPSDQALPFALGVLLTSALNVLKVKMLERSVNKIVNMENVESGKNFARLQYLLRYFLTGIVLVAAALTPFINIWGAIIGIFTLQISIIAAKIMKLDDNIEN